MRVPIPQLTSWLTAAYGLMAQLSNLRLSLAMHAREHATPDFAAAAERVSHRVDGLLAAGALHTPATPPLRPEDERLLAAMPHLLPRVRRTLDEAARVAAHAAQIEASIRPPAPEASPRPAMTEDLADVKNDTR